MAHRSIDNRFIEQLVANANLVQIIGTKVKLKRAGKSYKGLCPFHQEKTPSFSVDPEKNLFYCFGCQMAGNAINFIRQTEGLDFLPAVERLAELEGVPVVYQQGKERSPNTDIYHNLLQLARDFYVRNLQSDTSGVLRQLEQRGISAETVKAYELGVAIDRKDAFWSTLGEEKLREAALKLGLAKQSDSGDIYDFFRHRIIFPIHDSRKRPIGFGGRILGDKQGAKYINSSESFLFSKGREFYGLPQALAIKEEEGITLVEGYTDVLAFGLQKRVIACLGTAFTGEHAHKLFRHTSKVLFAFDGDAAGQAAALKAINQCLPFVNDEKNLAILFLPDGEDPNSLLLKGGLPAWHRLTETSLEQFLLRDLRAAADTNAKTDAMKKVAEHLVLMPDSYRKKLIQEEVKKVTGIELRLPEAKPPPARAASSRPKEIPVSSAAPKRLHRLVLAFLANPNLAVKTHEFWQDELGTIDSSHNAEITRVKSLLEAAGKGNDYLYGWLTGSDIHFGTGVSQISSANAENWVLQDVGNLLLENYKKERKDAVQKGEKKKLADIKENCIAPIKQKMAHL